MKVIPLTAAAGIRTYVQGLTNRVRDRRVDGLYVAEFKGGTLVQEHRVGMDWRSHEALAGVMLRTLADYGMEALLAPLERRGLDVASTLDFGRRVLGIRPLPSFDPHQFPPTIPHDLMAVVLSAVVEEEHHLSRDEYDRLNTALYEDPLDVMSEYLARSIPPEQWIQLVQTNLESAKGLAAAIETRTPDDWAVLFADEGAGPLDVFDAVWTDAQHQLLDRIEELTREYADATG